MSKTHPNFFNLTYQKISGKQKIVVCTNVSCGNLKNAGQAAYLIFFLWEKIIAATLLVGIQSNLDVSLVVN